ncbi:hypothetical protein DdX_15993 [Ditylenchus destructor]|uniref:Uncharacterized protein n=1 Tax=Ditylenchus destructor TaxID=166010 RepID=A0AAD4QX83_9BILA|nr:hypothetical protein DdX_15993 [Ditylenchus destructor]
MATSKCSKIDCFGVGIHYHVFIRNGTRCLDRESKIKVQCRSESANVEKEEPKATNEKPEIVPEVPGSDLAETAYTEESPNLVSVKATIELLKTRIWLLKSSAREILDENWLRQHVRHSRNSLQIRKCGDEACCKPFPGFSK